MQPLTWCNLNSQIVVKETRKKFFNLYLYNLKYFCPGGRILDYATEIDYAIERLKIDYTQYNYGGSWRARKDQVEKIDNKQLKDFSLIKRIPKDVKFRVEEPYVTLYANSEHWLFELASNRLIDHVDRLLSISKPLNEDLKKVLAEGKIIVKRGIQYKYKVRLRDGICEQKYNIGMYLNNLGDQIRISKSCKSMLEAKYDTIHAVWFYINDPDLVMMLNLFDPGVVSEICELVVT